MCGAFCLSENTKPPCFGKVVLCLSGDTLRLELFKRLRRPAVSAENKTGHSRAEVLFYFLSQQQKLGEKRMHGASQDFD